ncbi:glycoside hydrolase superfamily [Kalaharituber pfeilii]|nr:glycoside hydrolase superfamily [Kalaharituber pfeilii]
MRRFKVEVLLSTTLTFLSLSGTSFALIAKDGVSGRLPALGFNSWNAFRCDIEEENFITAAEKMVSLGLKDAGYIYVNIDDCWSTMERDNATGRLVPDPVKFPHGIKGTAEKVHALGLKLGIYSDAGSKTCAGYPGSLGYEDIDAQIWDEWGVDYLKYDNCNVPEDWVDHYTYWPENWFGGYEQQEGITAPEDYDWSQSNSTKRYNLMRDALYTKSKRTILYSLCSWGRSHVERWGNQTAQSWRIWGDIIPQWDGRITYSWGFMPIVNYGIFFLEYSDFWGHNDLDMLEVGNGNLTDAETRAHFGLWAALKSPLLIGTPLDEIQEKDIKVLKNWEILAFNQDPVYGKPALPYKWGINPDWTWNQTHPAEFYSGPSIRGIHVFILNTLNKKTKKSAVWSEIPGLSTDPKKRYKVRDMWTHKKLGVYMGKVELKLEAHDLAALLITEVDGGHPLHKGGNGNKYKRVDIPLPEVYQRKPRSWGTGPNAV